MPGSKLVMPPSTSDSLAELTWLRSFAARLASTDEDADDLVQDTMLSAWANPPREDRGGMRGWLSTVMRNRHRMVLRGRQRRHAREQRVAADEVASDSPSARLDRIEVLRVMVEMLDALPEHDRALIVRRYVDGVDAARIGEELGIPASTVRSRLRRSLTRLRASLDERFGERPVWAAAVVLPSEALAPGALVPFTKGVVIMSSPKIVILGGIVALGAATFVLAREDAPDAVQSEPVATVDSRREPPSKEATRRPSDREAVDTNRLAWERRLAAIRQRSKQAEADDAAAHPPTSANLDEILEEVKEAQQLAFEHCTDGWSSPITGALTLRSHVLGAPDVGTIYEGIDVVKNTDSNKDLLDCMTESMYAYVGGAPDEDFETAFTTTLLGRPPENLDDEAWKATIFESVVVAHVDEIRACVGEVETEGQLALEMSFGSDSLASEVAVEGLPEAAAECVVSAARQWRFPRKFDGDTMRQSFELPFAPEDAPFER
jgi:RNA polymerase sigma-70 factor, ECF subfamily